MLGTVTKDPGDQLDYDVDFSKWMPDGDSVSSAEAVSSVPAELVVESIQITDLAVKVWLSGGVLGTTYTITLTAATDDGRIKEVTFAIRMRDS